MEKGGRIVLAALIIILGVGAGFGLLRLKKKPAPPKKAQIIVNQVAPHNTPTLGNPRLDNPTADYIEEVRANQATQAIQTVIITSKAFDPEEVILKKGGIITWDNQDTVKHLVTGDSGLWGSRLELAPGKKFSQQFDVPGQYSYSCRLHPHLTGKIIVEE